MFIGPIYETELELEACTAYDNCGSKLCLRKAIYRKQMWFGAWVDGKPQDKQNCEYYLKAEDERIDANLRKSL